MKCTKRPYSRMGAVMALAQAQNAHNEYRPIRAYKCKWCRKWHLTSQKRIGKYNPQIHIN